MKLISYPQFISDMENYLDHAVNDQETYIMPWGEGKNVVMLSMDEYNELKKKAYQNNQ